MGVNVLIFGDNHNDNHFIRGNGAYRIATEIRNSGYTCQVIDFFGFMSTSDLEKIIEKYVDKDTLVVGFSSTFFTPSILRDYLPENTSTSDHIHKRRKFQNSIVPPYTMYSALYPFDDHIIKKYIIDASRKKNPNIKFVYGGHEAKRCCASFIDCFFYTFNDKSIIDYLEKIKHSEVLPTNYPLSPLEPEFSFLQSQTLWHESDHIFQGETLPLEISRGCIFKCKFCAFPLVGKTKPDYIKDPVKLREELIRNYELFGTTSYIITDDTFNDSTYKLELIFNEVTSKLPFKISFSCFLRLDLINAHREQIQLLRDMGMHFCYFGLESITPETQRIIGKSNSILKIEQLTQVLKDEWKKEVLTTGSFILGLPGDTKETYAFFKHWLINESMNYFDYPSVNPFYLNMTDARNPLTMSDIELNLEKYGYESRPSPGVYDNWYNKSIEMELKDVSKDASEIKNIILHDSRTRLGALWPISLYSMGYSFDFIANTQALEAMKIVLDNMHLYANKVDEYKRKITC